MTASDVPKTIASRPPQPSSAPGRSSRTRRPRRRCRAPGGRWPRGRGGGDRDVDEQAPAPVQVLGQQPAQDQAECGAAGGDRAEDAEGRTALPGVREGGGEQPQGRGGEQGAEPALEGAGAEEHGGAVRRAAEGGGGGEAQQADGEDAFAAEEVAQPSAEQQQAAEGERVGGDHPLPVGVGDAQVPLRRRQRDVHDGDVEDDHELGDGDDHQHPPAAAVRVLMTGGGLRRHWSAFRRGTEGSRSRGCHAVAFKRSSRTGGWQGKTSPNRPFRAKGPAAPGLADEARGRRPPYSADSSSTRSSSPSEPCESAAMCQALRSNSSPRASCAARAAARPRSQARSPSL